MEEWPQGDQEEQKDSRKRFGVTWKSCLLLTVMILGLLVTPLAIIYRLLSERVTQLPAVAQDDSLGVNRIAYITQNHQLATISPDGSSGRLLTDENRRFEFPAWSPNDSRLAVTGGDSLFILADEEGADDHPPQSIYQDREQQPFYLYWAPDSDRISFLTSHPGGLALYLADIDDMEEEPRLLEIGQPFYWDWTPSGEKILIHTGFSGNRARLAMINPADVNDSENIAEPGFFQAPGISKSGRYRAYAIRSEGIGSELVIQDEQGIIKAAEPHAGQVALSWSPKEELLAYSSPTAESIHSYGPLRLLAPDSGESRTLSQTNVLAFFWSPDGRHIAYLALPQQTDDSIQAVSFSAKSQLGNDSFAQGEDVKFELWLVDVQSSEKRRLAVFLPTGIFISQFLPFFDQYALSHILWSPQSDALVLPMIENGESHLKIVHIGSGEIEQLVEGEIGFWSHQ